MIQRTRVRSALVSSLSALVLIPGMTCAAPTVNPENTPPQVTFSFSGEQTLSLTQAKVLVLVDTTLNPTDLSTTLGNLSLIKDSLTGTWTLKNVSTSTTPSGLIDLKATLENILPLGETNNAYAFAKAETTPGETFTVSSVEPYLSSEQISHANQTLSLSLYQQAMAYQAQLQHVSGLPYHIAKVHFFIASPNYAPGPLMFAAMTRVEGQGNSPQSAAVSQKLHMSAEVTFTATASH